MLVFEGANLTGADLSAYVYNSIPVTYTNLAGANLINAILISINLSGANLTGANLTNANLTGAKFKQMQI